jgi:hypothetical protein
MISNMLGKQTRSNPPTHCLSLPEAAASLRRILQLGTFALLGATLTIAGDGPELTIDGGVRSGNPQYFDWKVTNHHNSPIVYIEFPHYHGDTFNAPDGWAQEWKNRMMLGGKDAPGWVRTSVENPGNGIRPGGSASFEMRLARAGALPRPGKVTVRFADGTELIVADVEVPSAHSFLEQNIMVFSLAVIFVIALAIHFRRRRRTAAPDPPAPAATPDQE